MKKQQIILIVIVVLIFAGLIYLGLKQIPMQETGSNNNQPAQPAGEEALSGAGGPSTLSPAVSEKPAWQNAANPSQSFPLEQSEVPKDAIKISITEGGIAPASFEAKAGAQIILAVSSGDQWTHVFKFKAKSLEQVAVGVGSKETRAITFYAPKEKGEYEYYCDVPGHITRGEKGVMIVK